MRILLLPATPPLPLPHTALPHAVRALQGRLTPLPVPLLPAHCIAMSLCPSARCKHMPARNMAAMPALRTPPRACPTHTPHAPHLGQREEEEWVGVTGHGGRWRQTRNDGEEAGIIGGQKAGLEE